MQSSDSESQDSRCIGVDGLAACVVTLSKSFGVVLVLAAVEDDATGARAALGYSAVIGCIVGGACATQKFVGVLWVDVNGNDDRE